MSAAIKACQIKCDTGGRREKYSNHLSNLFPELPLWELLLSPLTALTINFLSYRLFHKPLLTPEDVHEHINMAGNRRARTPCFFPPREGGTFYRQVSIIAQRLKYDYGSSSTLPQADDVSLKLKHRFHLFIHKNREITVFPLHSTNWK